MTAYLCLTFESPFASLRIQLPLHYRNFELTAAIETFDLNLSFFLFIGWLACFSA